MNYPFNGCASRCYYCVKGPIVLLTTSKRVCPQRRVQSFICYKMDILFILFFYDEKELISKQGCFSRTHACFMRFQSCVPTFCQHHQTFISRQSSNDDHVITVSEDVVRRELRRVNVRKAARPDGITGRVLRSCADQLAGLFTSIFNESFATSVIPHLI